MEFTTPTTPITATANKAMMMPILIVQIMSIWMNGIDVDSDSVGEGEDESS